MLMPLVAQGSKLKEIKGTWCLAKKKDGKPLVSLGQEIKFQDGKCIVTLLGGKIALNVEEGEDNLYIVDGKSGQSLVVSIIDNNTISIDLLFETLIYKRKNK